MPKADTIEMAKISGGFILALEDWDKWLKLQSVESNRDAPNAEAVTAAASIAAYLFHEEGLNRPDYDASTTDLGPHLAALREIDHIFSTIRRSTVRELSRLGATNESIMMIFRREENKKLVEFLKEAFQIASITVPTVEELRDTNLTGAERATSTDGLIAATRATLRQKRREIVPNYVDISHWLVPAEDARYMKYNEYETAEGVVLVQQNNNGVLPGLTGGGGPDIVGPEPGSEPRDGRPGAESTGI